MSESESGTSFKSWVSRIFSREPQDQEQLAEMLHEAGERDLVDHNLISMLEGVLHVSEMQVREVMMPRPQIIAFRESDALDDMLPIIIESGHSRFPVFDSSGDRVLGVLLAKDLLAYGFGKTSEVFDLQKVLRPSFFVSETKLLDTLIKEFRTNYAHMAIVVDEYGAVSGLITIEDALEQIVGEIEDEYDVEDDEEEYIVKHDEETYVIHAHTPLEEFNQYFDAHLEHAEFNTIGGMVMHQFGHIPKRDETVDVQGFYFRVLKSDNRRISLLEMTIVNHHED